MKGNEQEYDNMKSILTQTVRKQGIEHTEQRQTNNEQMHQRIFKYPYLVSRSSQKIQQDNMSNKSTQKPKTKNSIRKKIFEGRGSNSEDKKFLKQSTHSMDINLKRQNLQSGFNPIKSKLRNSSKNGKKSLQNQSQQSSFTGFPTQNHTIYQNVNINRNNPVIFHYASPNIGTPITHSIPHYYQQLNSFPNNYPRHNPQVQVLSYPVQNIYSPNLQYQYTNPPNLPIYNRVASQNYNFPYPSQSKSHIQVVRKPADSKVQNIYRSPNIPKYLLNNNPSPSNLNKQIIIQNSPNVQNISNSSPNKSPMLLTRPIGFFTNSLKQSDDVTKRSKNLGGIGFKGNQQRKSLFKDQPQPNSRQPSKEMIESYRISQSLTKNKINNILSVPTKKNTPFKNNDKFRLTPDASQSSLQQLRDNNEIDLHEVEELQNNNNQQHFYDRFFDMDFQQNKVRDHKTQKQLIKPQALQKYLTLNLEKSKSQKYSVSDQKRNSQSKGKKGTITSIKLQQKQKSLSQIDYQFQQQQNFKKLNSNFRSKVQILFERLNNEGKLVTVLLISLGFLLVIYQILK